MAGCKPLSAPTMPIALARPAAVQFGSVLFWYSPGSNATAERSTKGAGGVAAKRWPASDGAAARR